MSGVTLLGALTVQMDKIVLSRMVTVEQFGYYTVAATVAAGMLQLVYPLVQAVLPRAIQLRAEPAALRSLGIKLVRLIGMLVGLGALLFIAAGEWLLGVWLRNPAVVAVVYPLLAVLLVGTALNAFYNVGYINWIVHEKIRRVFQVNALALALSVALIPPLVAWQGTIGAAFGWLAINLIGFLLSLEWLKRKRDERNH
jgi:O-antigen/teichoic acid export membrane protein